MSSAKYIFPYRGQVEGIGRMEIVETSDDEERAELLVAQRFLSLVPSPRATYARWLAGGSPRTPSEAPASPAPAAPPFTPPGLPLQAGPSRRSPSPIALFPAASPSKARHSSPILQDDATQLTAGPSAPPSSATQLEFLTYESPKRQPQRILVPRSRSTSVSSERTAPLPSDEQPFQDDDADASSRLATPPRAAQPGPDDLQIAGAQEVGQTSKSTMPEQEPRAQRSSSQIGVNESDDEMDLLASQWAIRADPAGAPAAMEQQSIAEGRARTPMPTADEPAQDGEMTCVFIERC